MAGFLRAYNSTKRAYVATEVETAATALRRMIGLLGRRSLPPGRGLLLRPCNGIHTCFMRFSIDVVFIDRTGRAVYVAEDVRPFRFIPYVRGAAAALELPAGAARASGTGKGDLIVFSERKGDDPCCQF